MSDDDRNDRDLLEKRDLDLAYREYQLRQQIKRKGDEPATQQASPVASKKVDESKNN